MMNLNQARHPVKLVATVAAAVSMMFATAVTPAQTAAAAENPTEPQQEAPYIKPKRHFMVYYRAWRDKTMKGVNTSLTDPNWLTMHDIPYGVDVVNVFSYVPAGQEALAKPYFDKLKSDYTPYLHSRGIKLVRGIDYSGVILNGFAQFARVYTTWADVAAQPESTFDAYADKVIKDYMKPWDLDGLDIDMENAPSADEIAVSDKVIKAIAKRIGPKSSNSATTMFLYDTNGSNTDVFKNVRDCFNFLAYQQYGDGSDRTARAVSDYEAGADLAADKFVPGLTFPEEQDNNNRWVDATEPYEQSHIYSVAKYVREHNLGGMFLYAFDRDGRNYEGDLNHIKPSNLLWTKTAIAESQGMSLDQAKAAANHYLDRMSLTKTVPNSVRQAVKSATNLYEANRAILGRDWGQGFSNTYDPTLETALMTVNNKPLFDSIARADALDADQSVRASTQQWQKLADARKQAVEGLTGKAYTGEKVSGWLSALDTAISSIEDSQVPSGPSTPTQPTQPTKPADPLDGCPANPFPDAQTGWYANAVRYVNCKKVMTGYSNGTFGPEDHLLRVDAATLLWREAGSPSVSTQTDYTDQAQIPDYARTAVSWVAEKKIMNGYGASNTFGARNFLNRQEAAKIMARAAGVSVGEPSSSDLASYMKLANASRTFPGLLNYMVWAHTNHVINGWDQGDVIDADPWGVVTRAQMARIMANAMQKGVLAKSGK